MAIKYECSDFLMFQESLKKMRSVDDKIIYALNTSIPTESFKGQIDAEQKCNSLYDKLQTTHTERTNAIKTCILSTADQVKILKKKREDGINDDGGDVILLDKHFKSEQRKLRLLQSELNVEDIIKERTFKTFNERCRLFFKAANPL